MYHKTLSERMFDQDYFKIKVLVQGLTHYRVCSISFEPLVGFTNNSAQMPSMMRAYVWPVSNQGQDHSSRLNIVWLYYVSALQL